MLRLTGVGGDPDGGQGGRGGMSPGRARFAVNP